jgi:hypothetical protein
MTTSVTSLLATYAALLSSVGLGWNLYRDLHNRAKLNVSVSLRRISFSTDGKMYAVSPKFPVEASAETFVVISVLNVGQRPVKVNGWGGKYVNPQDGKSAFVVVPQGMPKMLNEWENLDEMTDELHGSIDNIKYLCVRDASGREWKAKRTDLARLKKDLRALREEESSANATRA